MTRSHMLLLVEDNGLDAELTLRTLRAQRLANPITVAVDGVAASDILFRSEPSAGSGSAQLPCLLLLDLWLPRLSGFDLLRAIRADERTAELPVIVLVSSARDQALVESQTPSRVAFVSKPVEFGSFARATASLGLVLWLAPEGPTESSR